MKRQIIICILVASVSTWLTISILDNQWQDHIDRHYVIKEWLVQAQVDKHNLRNALIVVLRENRNVRADKEAQYYRGFFDVCVRQTKNANFCRDMVREAIVNGWYLRPSFGWKWPPYREMRLEGG